MNMIEYVKYIIIFFVLVFFVCILYFIFKKTPNVPNTSNITCNNGTIQSDGSCVCQSTDFSGNKCQYSRDKTCSGNGYPNNDGTCKCLSGFYGQNCKEIIDCNGHGSINEDGSCICTAMYAGNKCQYSRDKTCSGNGYPNINGVCTCDNNESHPNGLNCQYTRSNACNGNGNPFPDGSCLCDKDSNGVTCQFTRSNTCNSRGEPKIDGTCTCDSPFTGVNCEKGDICNGNGEYNSQTKQCTCNHGFINTEDLGQCSVQSSGTCYNLFIKPDSKICSPLTNESECPCYRQHACGSPVNYGSDMTSLVYSSQTKCKSDCSGKYNSGTYQCII